MRMAIHDFVGHAFQTELSRELARRGHEVDHVFYSGFHSPNDHPAGAADDPDTLSLDPVSLPGSYPKYQYWRRYQMDRRYVKVCVARLSRFAPEVVLSANASPTVQAGLLEWCHARGIPFVSWVQDCYGIAAENILARRFGMPGRWIGKYIREQDNQVVLASDAVIFISDDFYAAFPGVRSETTTVIENWAPLSRLPMRPRVNPWSLAHGLTDARVFLYSGTLGLKHQPELLVQLAVAHTDGLVVVVSEGMGRGYLEARKRELGLSNLLLCDFQPSDTLPDVNGSADVLVAMVEKDAGAYSVPSKVLTYLCAGRPLLAAVPKSNLAARIVERSGAGIVVDPDDVEGFVRGALALLALDPERAREYGSRGRAYAGASFEIGAIADRFESVLQRSAHAIAKAVAAGVR